jgi:hypothetical protein
MTDKLSRVRWGVNGARKIEAGRSAEKAACQAVSDLFYFSASGLK